MRTGFLDLLLTRAAFDSELRIKVGSGADEEGREKSQQQQRSYHRER